MCVAEKQLCSCPASESLDKVLTVLREELSALDGSISDLKERNARLLQIVKELSLEKTATRKELEAWKIVKELSLEKTATRKELEAWKAYALAPFGTVRSMQAKAKLREMNAYEGL